MYVCVLGCECVFERLAVHIVALLLLGVLPENAPYKGCVCMRVTQLLLEIPNLESG